MKIIAIYLLFCVIPAFAQEETAVKDDQVNILDLKISFEAKDSLYLVKLPGQKLFYFYVISGEPIPELEDQDLFINIVDSEDHGWPVVEAGYIDTRYGVHEFTFDLHGKNFYLMATNGVIYSKINKFVFQ